MMATAAAMATMAEGSLLVVKAVEPLRSPASGRRAARLSDGGSRESPQRSCPRARRPSSRLFFAYLDSVRCSSPSIERQHACHHDSMLFKHADRRWSRRQVDGGRRDSEVSGFQPLHEQLPKVEGAALAITPLILFASAR